MPAVLGVQAFAWFSDLLVEHSEIFWSLFAVDMDRQDHMNFAIKNTYSDNYKKKGEMSADE
jgi:hypothetical protein